MDAEPGPAVVGVADHSGWANFVTLGVDDRRPVVVDRRRCELVDPDVPRQPYHAAEGLDVDEAESLVAQVSEAARSGARDALATVVAGVGPAHHAVALTVRAGRGTPPDSVAEVLSSHAAMHAAEGQLYRDVLAAAAEHHGLAVVVHARGEADAAAAAALGLDLGQVAEAVAALGRSVGPPWQKEHREAAAAALAELARHTPVELD